LVLGWVREASVRSVTMARFAGASPPNIENELVSVSSAVATTVNEYSSPTCQSLRTASVPSV